MSEYVITINSTSDLPKEWVWERKIPVVPLNCTIGGNTYRDMYDLSADEFYGMLRAGEMAVTSQPSPQAAIDMLEPILKEGKDILHIAYVSPFLSICVRLLNFAYKNKTLRSCSDFHVFTSLHRKREVLTSLIMILLIIAII